MAVAAASLAFVHDRLPDFGDMWRAATHGDPGWLAVVVIAEMASMGTFARLQRRLLLAGGVRMPIGHAVVVTYAGNALSTTLPAGPAVSVVYTFRQWRRVGASTQLATAVIVFGGIATTTAYTVIGLLALLAEPRSRALAATGLAVAIAAAAAMAVLWWHPRSRALLCRSMHAALRAVIRRGMRHHRTAPLVRSLAESLRQVRGVLRLTRGDWGAITVFALLNWLFDILALVAAAHAVGIHQVAPYAVALAYFTAQAAGSLFPVLPGGLGAIEGSMAATLVAFGAGVVPAGAAVGLYRIVSYWAVVSIGWLAWLALWAGDEARRAVRPQWRLQWRPQWRQRSSPRKVSTGLLSTAVGMAPPLAEYMGQCITECMAAKPAEPT